MSCTTPELLGATKYYYKYYSVLQSTTPVLLCTTKYNSVLLQYYSVLQSATPILLRTTNTTLYTPVLPCTTPVLPCTTKYYSSTNLYYKVLLQYYPVLQSTTPVLLCTTKYYSNTTLYYKVLLQYYSVLQILLCTTPVLPCTTKYYSSTTLYYSSTTLYYKVLLQYYPVLQSTSWLIRIAYETSSTMRRATGITLQLHQILRLPRKMNLMIDPHHIWNVIYNARSNSQHPPTSPNTAPATQNESHDWSTSHMKRHLQCAEQQSTPSKLTKYCACRAKWISWLTHITYETSFTMCRATVNTLQPHQILRLPRKMTTQHQTEICWKQLKRHFQCATDPSMIRDRSEHDPRMIRPWKRKTELAAPPRVLFALARSRFYWKLQRFPLRPSFQISPNAAPATKSDTWTSPNAAPATKSDTWTSPNAAPATKSDTWTPPNAAPATKS